MPSPNEEMVRRWFEEVWNQGRRETIAELMDPTCVVHDAGHEVKGVAAFEAFFDHIQATYSEIHVTIDKILSAGDEVCARWTATNRHTGPGLGIAPTGRVVRSTGLTLVRIRDGKFVEGWQNRDELGTLQQLGALDLPGAPRSATA